MDGVAFHDPMHEATKKPLTTVAACHCSPYSPGRQSRPHLFHVVRKVCTKSGHVSTIPSAVKNNSHHGISTIKSDYPYRLIRKRSLHNFGRKLAKKDIESVCAILAHAMRSSSYRHLLNRVLDAWEPEEIRQLCDRQRADLRKILFPQDEAPVFP